MPEDATMLMPMLEWGMLRNDEWKEWKEWKECRY